MEQGEPEEDTCAEDIKKQIENCDATVAEMEACQNDAIALGLGLVDKINCDAVPIAQEGNPFGEPESPASCVALEEKCPGITMDGMTSMTEVRTPSPVE